MQKNNLNNLSRSSSIIVSWRCNYVQTFSSKYLVSVYGLCAPRFLPCEQFYEIHFRYYFYRGLWCSSRSPALWFVLKDSGGEHQARKFATTSCHGQPASQLCIVILSVRVHAIAGASVCEYGCVLKGQLCRLESNNVPVNGAFVVAPM